MAYNINCKLRSDGLREFFLTFLLYKFYIIAYACPASWIKIDCHLLNEQFQVFKEILLSDYTNTLAIVLNMNDIGQYGVYRKSKYYTKVNPRINPGIGDW